MTFRSFDREGRAAPRVFTHNDPESKTSQEFKDDCNINKILARFMETGVLEHQAKYQGRYGDYLDAPQTLDQAENQVIEARAMFMDLPPAVREKFQNSPQRFLEAVDAALQGDQVVAGELVELGVLKPSSSAGAQQDRRKGDGPEVNPSPPETHQSKEE